MSTQQDIYAVGSKNRPPMLNKENYVPWSSRLLHYAKSKPNGKLTYNSIMNDYSHGLPEYIYAGVDSCETAQEIWLHVQQMMKVSDIGIQDKKAKLFNEWERFTSTDEESIESYYHCFSKLMNDFKRNKYFSEKIASNLKFLNNLQQEWRRHVTIVHQTKDLHKVDYTQLYDFLKYNQAKVVKNALQNPGIQNVGNQNRLIVVPGIANQNLNPNGNGNVVAGRAEGNAIGNNGDIEEIEEVNANSILMANLKKASTSGTQTDKALVYDSDGSAKNDSNVIFAVFSVEQCGGIVEQHPTTVEETHAYFESLYNNLAIEVEKVNSIHKFVKDKSLPLVNQVDARVKDFKIQFLKEAAKFVRDFKSLAKEADETLANHKALVLESKRLLRAVVNQDIMSIMQSNSVVDTSNLQTELERTKERFENCIFKKENEYAKLWNDWYKKCEECKYNKISYDKAYNDMQQKIKRLQAQLGDQKGKSKDTSCVSDTLDPLSQKLKNENVELEFQVLNCAKENAHLKTKYKNLFDAITVTQTQTKTIIDSFQNKLHDTIYKNAKLRAQLFDKVSEQKDIIKGTSANTKFTNQSTSGIKLYSVTPFPKSKIILKVVETNDLSKPVTSNSVPTPTESKVMTNDKVIAPGMFRNNPFKTSREDKFVPINKVGASVRTNSITVSQPHVINKNDFNSNSNGLSSTGVDIATKTRRPQPRSNTKNDKVPSASKSSCIKNKEVKVEEHHRNLLLSKNKKHMSFECNNVKLAI
ncbi:hypothetical protein Tco_1499344 [Tanacetum coccineum]